MHMSDEIQQGASVEAPKPEEAKTEAPVAPDAPKGDASDVEQNKVMAIVGYIIPILFFVPMLSEKKSPFGMYHANQQLSLLIAAIIVQIVGTVIPILGWFIILPLGMIAVVVLAILGIVNAAKGETKSLPIIGGFSIIK
jgi:uncharacterized membrane protein